MSGGGPRAHYIRSDSNDTNYDTSSVQLLLDTESQKNTKHRKVLIVLDVAIGVAVICLVLLLCVILLSYKSDGNVNLVKRNNTLNRSNLSSTPKTYNNTTIYNKEYEHGVRYDDKSLNISWLLDNKDIIVSHKDEFLPIL